MIGALEGKRLFIPTLLLLGAAILSALESAGGYVAALPYLMVPTADLAFILFWLAFSASSLARLMPSPASKYLIRNRRYIGLSFALVHFVHLVLVLSNITLTEASRPLLTLMGGGMAYLFLALMAATSNNAAVRWLGARRWKMLHRTGSYYIWLIFLATSLKDPLGRGWITALCLAALALRILAYRRGQMKKTGA